MKLNVILVSFTSLLFITACNLPHQPGPMPTEIVETEFTPGLNIFGVLRADGQAGSSFININRALTTEEIYSEDIENFSPEVDRVKVKAMTSDDESFFNEPLDSSDWGNYRDSTLLIQAGEYYDLEILAPGFPTLTGSTQVPEQPVMVENSLLLTPSTISFQIQHDVSAFEYKLYLIFADNILEHVVKASPETSVVVDWSFSDQGSQPLYLMITALDENLTRYGNSPISFIPNTYHPDPSTVEGGYGCFGSVAVSSYAL